VRRPDLRISCGQRVRELRKDRQLSQEELAEKAGLHPNYIGGIERGERNVCLLNIGRLAAAFGVAVSDLFRGFETKSR